MSWTGQEECKFIVEDVIEEAGKHGVVKHVELPRPPEHSTGVGLVFVEFADEPASGGVAAATRCRAALQGRSFNGQTVMAEYYPVDFIAEKVDQPSARACACFRAEAHWRRCRAAAVQLNAGEALGHL